MVLFCVPENNQIYSQFFLNIGSTKTRQRQQTLTDI